MKTYSVRRASAEHILKHRQKQKVTSIALLEDVVSKENPDEEYIMVLCEYLVVLNQYIIMIKKILDETVALKIPLSVNQLTIFKVFNTSVQALEVRSVKDYNLSLQIH
tara:strand:+ start:495 stop:818 length:324 start_codon:yes stop_codon:yes gene_type:complete